MSVVASLIVRAAGGGEGEGYEAPGPADFNLPPIGPHSEFEFLGQEMYLGVTKPMLQLVISVILVAGFFYLALRNRSLVPGKLQFIAEMGYDFVRNTLGRDVIGSKDFMKFVPLLVTLFFVILVNNYFGVIPFIQFPTMSRIGFPLALALIVWLVYNGVGIARHGFFGYLKLQTVPSGVPPLMYIILTPLEFFSNIIVRPFTLLLRLFANMFAGHLLLVLFSLGGWYLLGEASGVVAKAGGTIAWVMFFAISGLELLVHFLQAFIFTILTALYISSAVAEEH